MQLTWDPELVVVGFVRGSRIGAPESASEYRVMQKDVVAQRASLPGHRGGQVKMQLLIHLPLLVTWPQSHLQIHSLNLYGSET